MLVLAFFLCTRLAANMAERQGLPGDRIWDLSFWVFLCGILGGRIFYVVQKWEQFDRPFVQFFAIWQGGLVVYGAAIGALVAFVIFAIRHKIPPLWLLDLVAPALGLGLAIGRIGCLLNGCCYGDYCDTRLAIQFPAGSPPQYKMVADGNQTRLGFVTNQDDRRVLLVEPGTPAAKAGLAPGDEIVAVNGKPTLTPDAVEQALLFLGANSEAGYTSLIRNPLESLAYTGKFSLTVDRDGVEKVMEMTPAPSLPIQPTQIYSSIDGLVLFFFLYAWYPYRKRDGQMIALFAMAYAITRFLIEYLRSDEAAFSDGLTISQNVSLIMFSAGLAVLLFGVLSQRARLTTAIAT